MKIETHFHAFGGSRCADGNNELAVEKYLQAGYDGVVVTTHYCLSYYVWYSPLSHKEKMDYFFKVYDDFATIANKRGLKTFFGAEVRCVPTNTEYMLLGFDRQLLGASHGEAGHHGMGTGHRIPWGNEGASPDGGPCGSGHLVHGALVVPARSLHHLQDVCQCSERGEGGVLSVHCEALLK